HVVNALRNRGRYRIHPCGLVFKLSLLPAFEVTRDGRPVLVDYSHVATVVPGFFVVSAPPRAAGLLAGWPGAAIPHPWMAPGGHRGPRPAAAGPLSDLYGSGHQLLVRRAPYRCTGCLGQRRPLSNAQAP